MSAPTQKPHHDGWNNVLTALGVQGRDKRLSGQMAVTPLSHEQLLDLWRGDDVAARMIEVPPREMLRQGYNLRVASEDATQSAKTQKAIAAQMDDLGATTKLYDALCYERAFGGGAILVGADDGVTDLRLPLDVTRLKAVRWLTALHNREVQADRYYEDPTAPRYGSPMWWRIQPEIGSAAPVVVHESRLLLFGGIQLTRRQVWQNQGWGDPVLLRVYDVIRDFAQAYGGAAALLQDFSQAVFKIKDLAELIQTNQDEVVLNRLKIIDLARSMIRAVVLDSEEEFERKTTPLTGLDGLLDKFMLRVAAAVEMPVSLLMGQAPAGLNATGDSDIRWFYDGIKSRQSQKLKPTIERLLRMLFLSKEGPTKGKEPESWEVLFAPLWQLTEVEQAELRNKQANTDETYIRSGVLTPEEVAVSRFGGDGYSTETVIDLEARRSLKEEPTPKAEDPKKTPPQNGAVPS